MTSWHLLLILMMRRCTLICGIVFHSSTSMRRRSRSVVPSVIRRRTALPNHEHWFWHILWDTPIVFIALLHKYGISYNRPFGVPGKLNNRALLYCYIPHADVLLNNWDIHCQSPYAFIFDLCQGPRSCRARKIQGGSHRLALCQGPRSRRARNRETQSKDPWLRFRQITPFQTQQVLC